MILFGKETLEGGAIPASFASVGVNWGAASAVLDSASQLNGTYSIKFSNTGEGSSSANADLGAEETEIFLRIVCFIPNAFSFGAAGYTGFLDMLNDASAQVLRFNVEDYGTYRLSANSTQLGYTDTGIDLPKGVLFTLQIYAKLNATTGYIKIWLDNEVEGSPDYDSGNKNTGSDGMQTFRFGKTYVANATDDFFMDDFILADAFISGTGEPATGPKIKSAGSFVASIPKYKTGGAFVDKVVGVKVGGSF